MLSAPPIRRRATAADVLGRGLGGSSSAARDRMWIWLWLWVCGGTQPMCMHPDCQTASRSSRPSRKQVEMRTHSPACKLAASACAQWRSRNRHTTHSVGSAARTAAAAHPTVAACVCRCPHLRSHAAETRRLARLHWRQPAAAGRPEGRSTPQPHGSRPPTCAVAGTVCSWSSWVHAKGLRFIWVTAAAASAMSSLQTATAGPQHTHNPHAATSQPSFPLCYPLASSPPPSAMRHSLERGWRRMPAAQPL